MFLCGVLEGRFTDKDVIAFSGQTLVPVIIDPNHVDEKGEPTVVSDSWKVREALKITSHSPVVVVYLFLAIHVQIALYLEDKYPDLPSLFTGDESKWMNYFVTMWANTAISSPLFGG